MTPHVSPSLDPATVTLGVVETALSARNTSRVTIARSRARPLTNLTSPVTSPLGGPPSAHFEVTLSCYAALFLPLDDLYADRRPLARRVTRAREAAARRRLDVQLEMAQCGT